MFNSEGIQLNNDQFSSDEASSPPPQQSTPAFYSLPAKLFCALVMFGLVLHLVNKQDAMTTEEEMNIKNLMEWCAGNLAGAATLNFFTGWNLLWEGLKHKAETGRSVKDILSDALKAWGIGTARGFVAFALFSMNNISINNSHYAAFAKMAFRMGNAAMTLGLMDYLEKSAFDFLSMLELWVALVTIEYGPETGEFFMSMLSPYLSGLGLDATMILLNAALPALAALSVGAMAKTGYHLITSYGRGFFQNLSWQPPNPLDYCRKTPSNNDEEKKILAAV